MANHKGEPECITCAFHENTARGVFCHKHSSDIPSKSGPYLICRLWQGYDGKTLDESWKNKYLPLENALYRHDIYMVKLPTVVKKFGQ